MKHGTYFEYGWQIAPTNTSMQPTWMRKSAGNVLNVLFCYSTLHLGVFGFRFLSVSVALALYSVWFSFDEGRLNQVACECLILVKIM